MFPTFTGNSRRPRQVNLSGRNPNPFASSSKDALANAQQERQRRQQARDEQNAVLAIQKVWRSHNTRTHITQRWRRTWNDREGYQERSHPHEMYVQVPDQGAYLSADECLEQLHYLLLFLRPRHTEDARRLIWFAQRLMMAVHENRFALDIEAWRLPLLRLERKTLRTLDLVCHFEYQKMAFHILLQLLNFVSACIPEETGYNAVDYFSTLSRVTSTIYDAPFKMNVSAVFGSTEVEDELLEAVLAPLRSFSNQTSSNKGVYQTFAMKYLTTSNLHRSPKILSGLARSLDYKSLERAIRLLFLHKTLDAIEDLKSPYANEKRFRLLAHFIYLNRQRHQKPAFSPQKREPDFIAIVAMLLGSVAPIVRSWVDDATPLKYYPSLPMSMHMFHEGRKGVTLKRFYSATIFSLIDQQSISSLLSEIGSSSAIPSPEVVARPDEEAKVLASYALTLLKVFPRRSIDLRTWLLGAAFQSSTDEGSSSRPSAIKYFWNTARSTTIFEDITRDHRSALQYLNVRGIAEPVAHEASETLIQQDWMIILLFLELFTSALRVLDDEEFLSGGNYEFQSASESGSFWTKTSALPISDVKKLTIFLKHFAFTMYWYPTGITASGENTSNTSIGSYFNRSVLPDKSKGILEETVIAGIKGMSIDYVKKLATGLLRMIYERDSRRRFLPKDYWLMNSMFDMSGFTEKVVMEEERRHMAQQEEQDDEDDDEHQYKAMEQPDRYLDEIFDYSEQVRQKGLRKKYLESISPRLEILQSMPFFIPFDVRVSIFRKFITVDRMRRLGRADAGMARAAFALTGARLGMDDTHTHHAKIRRDHVFEDAYKNFYSLGDGLKEGIHITFEDQFGTAEAGIDGGGVTKEFLTSVTNEAFSQNEGLCLFVENDQNLLYPNPSAMDHIKAFLRQSNIQQTSPTWKQQIQEVLRQYEFLGRIIGKCLYEDILVDVRFAGFFVLKWALTNGSGAGSSRESGYRANLNDVRDLDEGLYQGLLKLKNYPGDVEDFGLNFTVEDPVSHAPHPNETPPFPGTITRELQPGGGELHVTNTNRIIYIQYVARHRLSIQPAEQTSAFLRGLSSIINPSWLNMFNQEELQTLVGGDSSGVDVNDLRQNTVYGGLYVIGDDRQEHPTIVMFWEVMRELNKEEKAKVVKYVTSTPRAPLLGFGMLSPRFSIRDAGNDEERLPSSSTCVNLLKLPVFKSKERLKSKLLYAVSSGAGFDLS